MDIYDYINSRDVAAYCREINKTWTAFEMAVIIGRSHRAMADKHKAWCELITDYSDMPVPKNIHYLDYLDSLHQRVKGVIDYEERLLALFETPETGAVYTWKVWWHDDCKYSDSVFMTLEEAVTDMRENWERDESDKIVILKIFAGNKGTVESHSDYDGNIYRLYYTHGDCAGRFPDIDFDSVFDFGQDFCIDIPAPFKRGDILTYNQRYNRAKETIFVLDHIDRDNPKWVERFTSGNYGDGTDMNGWGYFVDGDGLVYENHVMDYDSVEYYRGKLENKDRILQYVSWYLKGEIALSALLTMQCRVVAQYQLDNALSIERCSWLFLEKHIIADGQADHVRDEPFKPASIYERWDYENAAIIEGIKNDTDSNNEA